MRVAPLFQFGAFHVAADLIDSSRPFVGI
jgi:hypothetical protein